MKKIWIWNIVFIVVAVIAFIPLTVEIFGELAYEEILPWSIIFLVGLFGSCICAFIRVGMNLKKKGSE